MKLKKLVLENINSFEGVFEIDFGKFENTLFLITGATGAGKSTIIDSILAALYDRTPRLLSSKHLLNKDSDYAKIELEFVSGDEYKIVWSVKRNKSVKRQLFKNSELIADKSAEIKSEILKIIKLDFNEFTKAVILAQGEFDAFLSANDKEKSKLLENILELKEFEAVSKKVYEKTKKADDELSVLTQKIQEIDISELKPKQKELKELEKALNKDKALLQKAQKANELKQLKNSISEEIDSFKLKLQQNEEKKELIKKQLLNIDLTQVKEFELYKQKAQKELQELEESIKKDIKLQTLQKNLSSARQRKEKILNEIKTKQAQKNTLLKQKTQYQKSLESLNLDEDKRFENFDEINAIYARLLTLRDEYQKRFALKKEYSQKIENLKNQEGEILQNMAALKQELENLGEVLKYLEFEEERKRLKPNTPCPLCGSKTHPYVTDPPGYSKVLLSEIDKKKENILKLENKLAEIKKEIDLLTDRIENLKLQDILNEGTQTRDLFKKYGLIEDEFEALKAKKSEFEKQQKEKTSLSIKLSEINATLKSIDEFLSNNSSELIDKEIEGLESEIARLLSEIIPDAANKKDELLKSLNKKQEDIIKLQNEHIKLNSQLQEIEGFIKNLQKEIELKTKKLLEIKIEEIDADIEKLKSDIERNTLRFGELSTEIKNLKIQQELLKALKSEHKQKEEKLKRLKKLNSLIGSADGAKFKKIALSYLMGNLLDVANEYFQKITNSRYIFEMEEDLGNLNLSVIDRYYENSKRDVKGLSGGEKFLASLSLAFGLSDMVKRVDIGFMFLDEGFGSLDVNSLDRAVEILKEASRGKMVGIISHVESLKEEINTQIKVEKKPNGRSVV
ncbi:MAG: AAA family ATPase, partial [Epsilonproteobacteria bacterium]|nr:AAA family ATPase [Campylobacterota bacterium]